MPKQADRRLGDRGSRAERAEGLEVAPDAQLARQRHLRAAAERVDSGAVEEAGGELPAARDKGRLWALWLTRNPCAGLSPAHLLIQEKEKLS